MLYLTTKQLNGFFYNKFKCSIKICIFYKHISSFTSTLNKLVALNDVAFLNSLIFSSAKYTWRNFTFNILVNNETTYRKQLFLLTASCGPRQANSVLIGYASSEGTGEPAHPRSLARTFAARSYKQ